VQHDGKQGRQGTNGELIPVQRMRFTKDTGGIFEEKQNNEKTGQLTEKIRETGSTDQWYDSDRPKHARTEENVITVCELALSQEDQTQTHRSTHQEQTDRQTDGQTDEQDP